MDSMFINMILNFDTFIDNRNKTISTCVKAIDDKKFYLFCMIPSITLTVLMAFTKRRKIKLLYFLNGRPALIYPINSLQNSDTVSYCCAFGATVVLQYNIITDKKFVVEGNGSKVIETFIAALSMFIYGLAYFPIFACLTLRSAFAYGLGSLYSWLFFVVSIYQLTECNFNKHGRAIYVARSLPIVTCLGYLSVSLPVRCAIACSKRRFFKPLPTEDSFCETIEDIRRSYQGHYVRKLLKKPEFKKHTSSGIINKVKDIFYRPHKGFRYPTMLSCVMFIGLCVVYMMSVEIVTLFLAFNDLAQEVAIGSIESMKVNSILEPYNTSSIMKYEEQLQLVHLGIYILKVSIVVSIVTTAALTFLIILQMLASYRSNLFAMYRGDYSFIRPPSKMSAVSSCIASMEFAGFQVAYIVWGFFTSSAVSFIICIVTAVFCLLIVKHPDWILQAVLSVLPHISIGLGVILIQWLLAKKVFLQPPGKNLQLNNRRLFFIYTYFMFFFNIFIGFFSCLMRIVNAVCIGTLYMSRLDSSTLPRKFESKDPGFSAYQGYIHLQAAHTHPVMIVFIRILVSLRNSRKDEKILSEKMRRKISARFFWHVIYTLLHNPAVRLHRKGYAEALKQARRTGVKIPISDKPITEFVKMTEESNM